MQDKIHNSLSNKLILRILLMAAPIFLMALGFIFIQSRSSDRKPRSMPSACSTLPCSVSGTI